MTINKLSKLFEKKNIHISEEQQNLLSSYMTLLIEWNEKINLTAIKEPGEIVEKHFYDCLLLATFIDFDSQSIIDIGSGAGFPGIPLKIVFPKLDVVLLEPTGKRFDFLDLVIKELKLTGIRTINDRAENLSRITSLRFDIAVARAVAPLRILNELALPLVKTKGLFIAMKGPAADTEVAESKNSLNLLYAHIQSINETTLVTNDDIRKIVIIQKDRETPNKYPRDFAQIKKKPL